MSQAPFGWCFIGCGTLAQKVARQLVPSGRHRIVSVFARSPERRDAFAAKWGALSCDSAEAAMNAPGVDGVYIVTPHNSHFAYAAQALEAGKPVLCEKPLTVNAREAARLIALSEEKQVYLAEAMWTWFAPVANQVKAWLDAGEFGTLRKVVVNYHCDSRGYAKRVTDPSQAGGALLDIGVYALTYLYRLFGPPEKVTCRGTVSEGIDWEEDVTFHYPGGVQYTASISIRDFRGYEHLTLVGDKARVFLLPFHYSNRVKLKRRHGRSSVTTGSGNYLNEFDQAAAEIRAGLTDSRFVPHSATLAVMEIMDECRRQLGLVYPFEAANLPDEGGVTP